MNPELAVKITQENMDRIIKRCLIEDAPIEIVDVWTETLTSEIEGAWAEGLEAFATEGGFVFAKPGAMEQYKVASA
jgi:hypothetical protein